MKAKPEVQQKQIETKMAAVNKKIETFFLVLVCVLLDTGSGTFLDEQVSSIKPPSRPISV